ncbi:phosphatase PAP2 family protein [Butyrivibrio sp. JL13D10]|uniref:phosphatase PAP2 family protein n=1 Tax=Butyrivibrio sp. JL13D10 TaxID=3236815 RepID=UPI0038B4E890
MGNTFYFDFEPQLMGWLQNTFGETGSGFISHFSAFGEEAVFILVLGFLYWCYDKRFAIYIGTNVVVGGTLNPLIKNVALRLRPYMVHENIQCFRPLGKSEPLDDVSAQGYSFPSAHSMNAATVYGSIAGYMRKRIATIIAVILTILVGISRVVVGVHYPTDVLTGWVAGVAIVFIIPFIYEKAGEERRSLINFIFFLFSSIGFFYCKTDDYYTAMGVMAGFYLAIEFEKRFVNFEETRIPVEIIMRIVGGAAFYLILNLLLKLPFSQEFLKSNTMGAFMVRFVRYTIIVFVMLGVYPMLFKYFKRNTNAKNESYLFKCCLLTIIVILFLIPVIYVARYAFPWADDFTYGALPHRAFVHTGSVINAIGAAFADTIDTYFGWQGTYTSCFLMELHPAVFKTEYYHLTSFIMLGAMFISYFALFKVMGKDVLKMNRMNYILFILTFFISVELVDGKAEGFTWYNSAVHYTFGHALFVLFLALLLKSSYSIKESVPLIIISSFVGFLAAGVNNITVFGGLLFLIMAILFALLCQLLFGNKDIVIIKRALIPSAVFLIGTALNLLSPGNRNRMAMANSVKNSVFVTVRNSFVLGFHFILRHINFEVLGFVIIAGILIWRTFYELQKKDKVHFRFPLPGVISVLSYCLISALYAPFAFIGSSDITKVYIEEQLGVNRVSNSVFYVFILLIVLNVFYFMGWLFSRKQRGYNKSLLRTLSVAAVFMIVAACIRVVILFPERYLTSAAVMSLRNNTAQQYGEIMLENTRRLMSDEQNVEILPITVDPDILYPHDGSPYKDGAVIFYEKESVYYKE